MQASYADTLKVLFWMSKIQGWGEKLYTPIPFHLLFVEIAGITLQIFGAFWRITFISIKWTANFTKVLS